MKIASWNVNSIRTRCALVADWVSRVQPDILLLQETKCEAAQFPAAAFEALGYRAEVVGQKSYNGVAILSRQPVEITRRALPGHEDDGQARYIEASYEGVLIGGLYLPNGNSNGDAGYQAKLDWMASLYRHARDLAEADRDFILAGDYNVCPTDADYARGTLGADDALVRPETRAAFRSLLWLGLTDAMRALHPNDPCYTFWDYQAGCWPRDRGLRIDHALLSPRLTERLTAITPDKSERDRPQPSDHVPVVVTLGEA